MPAYKIIAVLLAYGALWQALSCWRVRAPERRLQLQLYGCVALLYLLMVAVTGGMSPSLLPSPLPPGVESLCTQYVRAYFGSFAIIFLLLGILEIGVSAGFYDPSLPLLSRWWVHAPFEGPGWRLLCQRAAGTPFTADEAEAMARHAVSGVITVMSAFWAMQVSLGALEWGRLDPVALVILLKAVNTWLDARLRPRVGATELSRQSPVGYPVHGCVSRTSRVPRVSRTVLHQPVSVAEPSAPAYHAHP